MKNQYLEKIASHRDAVTGILTEYNRRHNEIEEPIDRMHETMDELEESIDNEIVSEDAKHTLDRLRREQEENLRTSLDTLGAHKTNKYNTAVKLLNHGGLPSNEGSFDADHVIRTFQNVHRGTNGQVGLSYLGVVPGGIGGALLGGRAMGPLGALVGGIAGTIGAGALGSHLMKSRIAERKLEIDNEHEHALNAAYNIINSHVSKG